MYPDYFTTGEQFKFDDNDPTTAFGMRIWLVIIILFPFILIGNIIYAKKVKNRKKKKDIMSYSLPFEFDEEIKIV